MTESLGVYMPEISFWETSGTDVDIFASSVGLHNCKSIMNVSEKFLIVGHPFCSRK
jgi:hypothetical protein